VNKRTTDSASELPLQALRNMLQKTSDWVFRVDRDGTLSQVDYQRDHEPVVNFRQWVGRSFHETVTVESKPKIEELLAQKSDEASQWRQVNHPLPDGPDLPVRYSALALDKNTVLLVGQNVEDMAKMQQRLIQAQQALESDFARMAQARSRYQLVFDLSAEALLNVDANTRKIIDANPAAQRLLGPYIAPLKNNRFPTGFDDVSTAALEELLKQAERTGRADDVAIASSDQRRSFLASAALLRDRIESTLMVRLSPMSESAAEHITRLTPTLFEAVVEGSPDAVLICDDAGRIVTANNAFANMAQLPSVASAVGKRVDQWLGRSELDHRLLSQNLKEHGTLPKFATIIAGAHGLTTDVEISAATIDDPRFPHVLLIIRNVQSRLPSADEIMVPTPGAPLKELVGRVPLKELVRESTNLIEKLCIESALEMTSDNRASAAEMLGVSRQSLYTKLRRFGIADQAPNHD
jgi:transcriptional regulator PpsR